MCKELLEPSFSGKNVLVKTIASAKNITKPKILNLFVSKYKRIFFNVIVD